METMYDSMLSSMCEHGIDSYINTTMSFLYRKTDFFQVLHSVEDKKGFAPGKAFKMLQNSFELFRSKAEEDEKKEIGKNFQRIHDIQTKKSKEEENKTSVQQTAQGEAITEQDTPEAKQLKDEQKVYQQQCDSYNGADREYYTWSQNITEIDILIKIPADIVKGRNVRVKVQKLSLKAEYLEVNIDKVTERWWDCAFASETRIDIKHIDATRPIEDLDDESQSKIHELMASQRDKRMGVTSSADMKKQELLKKAWNAKGSPFKGTEFDPSVLNINNGLK